MNDNKYNQLQEWLKEELRSGRFKPGDQFYTNKELMEKYQLSYATVTRAMAEMVEKGYFERQRGVGTVVLESSKTPGMTGDIMTRTLYLGYPSYEAKSHTRESLAWFVTDGIRRGVINNYPGPVKLEPFTLIRDMLEAGEDILTILHSPPKKFIHKHNGNFPNCVVINHRRDFIMKHNSVSWEMISGVYEIIGHLIQEYGHQRVGFIGGNKPKYFADRFAGYRIALEAHEIPYREELCIRGLEGTVADGRNAMKQLMSLKEPPTAIFADTDLKAFGAIEAAKELGLRVPDDISVVGFDDMPDAAKSTPPLSTVRIPYYEIGKCAVEMLLERIKTEQDIPSKIIRSEFIRRESSALCRQT